MSAFFFFFQIKLSGKIGWVSLNSVSKKLFEFDSKVFHRFFKVLATDGMADGMRLMFNRKWSFASRSTSSMIPPD